MFDWNSAVSSLLGAVVGSLVTGGIAWKVGRDANESQAKIARESWRAQELIAIKEARGRWTTERLEKLLASLDVLEKTRIIPGTQLNDQATQTVRDSYAAEIGLELEAGTENLLNWYRRILEAIEQRNALFESRRDPESEVRYQEVNALDDNIDRMVSGFKAMVKEYVKLLRSPAN